MTVYMAACHYCFCGRGAVFLSEQEASEQEMDHPEGLGRGAEAPKIDSVSQTTRRVSPDARQTAIVILLEVNMSQSYFLPPHLSDQNPLCDDFCLHGKIFGNKACCASCSDYMKTLIFFVAVKAVTCFELI